MLTVMTLNSKGGSGKTTLATNLAGYYASQNMPTVIKDYDPQGSSSEWLKHRPYSRAHIQGIEAFAANNRATKAWQMRLPPDTQRLIIDSPAGVDLLKMASVMKNVDRILIPVSPSPIDIRATAIFIRDLYSFIRMYPTVAKIGVVANRVQKNSPSFLAMQRVFTNLDIPFVGVLSQNDRYIQAAEHGVSLLELEGPDSGVDQQEWASLLAWLETGVVAQQVPAATPKPRMSAFARRY